MTPATERFRGSLMFQGALLFLLFYFLYLRTLSPSLAVEGDSGEFLTALGCSGVPHEPGYASYMTALLACRTLFPGSPDFAANLFSALMGALAVALTLPLGRALGLSLGLDETASRASGIAAALLLGSAGLLWEQNTITEAYAPAQALISLAVLAGLRAGRGPGPWAALGLLAGFGFGIHPFVPLAAVAVVGARALVQGPGFLRGLRNPGFLIWGGLLGLSTTLYLPLRAVVDPALNFGNPRNFGALVQALERASYKGQIGLTHFGRMMTQASDALGFATRSWPAGILVVFLALTGLALVLRARRGLGLILLGLSLALYPGLAWALNFNHLDSGYYQSRVFFIPGLQLLCLLAGLALGRLLSAAQGAGAGPVLLLLPAGFCFMSMALTFPVLDRSRDYLSFDYGRALLEELPPGAAVVTEGDNSLYPLFYFTLGRGLRPDLALLHRGALSAPWYQDALRRRQPNLILLPGMGLDQVVSANASLRPLYFTEPREELPQGFAYWPEKGLYRVARMGEVLPLPRTPPPVLRWGTEARDWDWREQSVLALQRLWYLRSAEVLARSRNGPATWERALAGLALSPDHTINYDRWVRQGLHKLLASVLASGGRPAEAAEEERRAAAIQLDPQGP